LRSVTFFFTIPPPPPPPPKPTTKINSIVNKVDEILAAKYDPVTVAAWRRLVTGKVREKRQDFFCFELFFPKPIFFYPSFFS
jgi:hypothetical protein